MNSTIHFTRLPDHAKRQAAPDLIQGKQWFWFGSLVEAPDAKELAQWITPSGNKSQKTMMRNADVFLKRSSVPHAKKRILADCLIAAKSTLSNRELARIGGVSHTYIANRRRIAKSGNK